MNSKPSNKVKIIFFMIVVYLIIILWVADLVPLSNSSKYIPELKSETSNWSLQFPLEKVLLSDKTVCPKRLCSLMLTSLTLLTSNSTFSLSYAGFGLMLKSRVLFSLIDTDVEPPLWRK